MGRRAQSALSAERSILAPFFSKTRPPSGDRRLAGQWARRLLFFRLLREAPVFALTLRAGFAQSSTARSWLAEAQNKSRLMAATLGASLNLGIDGTSFFVVQWSMR